MITIRQINKWLLLLGIGLLANACYKTYSGCLDVFSNNFDAGADAACESCCEYPSLGLSVSFGVGDETFSFSDTITNGVDSFKIVNAGIYIHDFLIRTVEDSIAVRESSNFWFESGGSNFQSSLKNDFAAISPLNGTTYQLGTHAQRVQTTSVNFTLGAAPSWNELIQDSIPDASDLNGSNNLLYNSSDGYATAYMELVYDFETGDTVSYQLPLADLMVPISLDTTYLVDYGQNVSIPIRVDLLKWTTGIDFAADGLDTALIKLRFVENIPNSVSLNN